MSRKAFTLIELLVVIAILGLLAAVLFPVFAKVRENGRRTVCLSNERQLGMAIFQYAQDSNGILPWGSQVPLQKTGAGNIDSPTGEGWAGQVFPFITSAGVFRCPDDATEVPPDDRTCVGVGCHPKAGAARYTVSYGFNGRLLQSRLVQGRLAELPLPARTVLLFEVSDDWASLASADEATGRAAPGYMQVFSAGGSGGFLASIPGNGTMLNPSPGVGGAIYATGWLGGLDPYKGWPHSQPTFYGDRLGRHEGGQTSCWLTGTPNGSGPKRCCPIAESLQSTSLTTTPHLSGNDTSREENSEAPKDQAGPPAARTTRLPPAARMTRRRDAAGRRRRRGRPIASTP